MVCTDPPYRLTSGGNGDPSYEGHIRMRGVFDNKKYDNGGQIVECDIGWTDFMPLLFASMDRGHAYVMANDKNVRAMLNAAHEAGFRFHNLLPWDKITATPNRWYMKNCEFTGMFFKGAAFAINDCSAKQLISCPQVDETSHPTGKPVALMQHYIENSTQRGQIVLDPFMGSASTGIAAIRSGRKFIGIEKNRQWFDVACDRINEEFRRFQKSLF